MKETTIDQFQLPMIVRAMNKVGIILNKMGISPVNLTEASIIEAAVKETGLSDLGSEDFKIPLDLLLTHYREDADLSLLGKLAARHESVRLLSNRLKMENDFKAHPEILREKIHKPLFIIGFPRTGTTLLHCLLGEDNAARVPLMWEIIWPSPPPAAGNRQSDQRIKMAEKRMQQMHVLVPQMRTMHPTEPESPEECLMLFQHNFASLLFDAFAEVPNYRNWLLSHNMVPEYQYYKQQLQLLQWRSPADHWVLKTPFHLFGLDALLAVFPDASIVQTHRTPREVFGSLLSLIAVMRKLNSNHVDLEKLGRTWLSTWGKIMDHAMAVRESADPARFYDADFRDLVGDPVGVVKNIYRKFDYPFSSEFEIQMQRWVAENPRNKHGEHIYSLEQFGLSAEMIDERFADYIQRFSIR